MERIHEVVSGDFLLPVATDEAAAKERALTVWAVALNIALLVDVSFTATLLMPPKVWLSLVACIFFLSVSVSKHLRLRTVNTESDPVLAIRLF